MDAQSSGRVPPRGAAHGPEVSARSRQQPGDAAAPGINAILIGGPKDQTPFAANEVALVELEIDGLVHRYARTHQKRDWQGRSLLVYNYDGSADKNETGQRKPLFDDV